MGEPEMDERSAEDPSERIEVYTPFRQFQINTG
jgi:hypothetical protein